MEQVQMALTDLDGTLRPSVTKDILKSQIQNGILGLDTLEKSKELAGSYEKGDITHKQYLEMGLAFWAERLKGKEYQEIYELSKTVFEQTKDQMFDYVIPAFTQLKGKGFEINIITSQPDFVVQALSDTLKDGDGNKLIDGYRSSVFETEVQNGTLVFTGNVSRLIGDADDKYNAAKEISKEGEKKIVFALGNDDPDYGMYIQADFPIHITAEDTPSTIQAPKESKYQPVSDKLAIRNLNDVGKTILGRVVVDKQQNPNITKRLEDFAK